MLTLNGSFSVILDTYISLQGVIVLQSTMWHCDPFRHFLSSQEVKAAARLNLVADEGELVRSVLSVSRRETKSQLYIKYHHETEAAGSFSLFP